MPARAAASEKSSSVGSSVSVPPANGQRPPSTSDARCPAASGSGSRPSVTGDAGIDRRDRRDLPGRAFQREQVGEADLAAMPGDRAERGGEIGAGGAEHAGRWSRRRASRRYAPSPVTVPATSAITPKVSRGQQRRAGTPSPKVMPGTVEVARRRARSPDRADRDVGDLHAACVGSTACPPRRSRRPTSVSDTPARGERLEPRRRAAASLTPSAPVERAARRRAAASRPPRRQQQRHVGDLPRAAGERAATPRHRSTARRPREIEPRHRGRACRAASARRRSRSRGRRAAASRRRARASPASLPSLPRQPRRRDPRAAADPPARHRDQRARRSGTATAAPGRAPARRPRAVDRDRRAAGIDREPPAPVPPRVDRQRQRRRRARRRAARTASRAS